MPTYIDLMKPFKSSRFVGINLLTVNQPEKEAKKTISDIESKIGIPTTDLVRFGDQSLIDSILKDVQNWN